MEKVWALLPPLMALRALLVAAACLAAGSLGAELQRARTHAQNLSAALATERSQGKRVEALFASLVPTLEALDVEGVLG